MRRGLLALAGALLAGVALVGCSQIAAISPVGGARESEVRYAAIDVLLDKGVEVRTAPVCATTADEITCSGDTMTGDPIQVRSTADAPDTFTLTVGDETLYSGSTQDVLEAAMQG